MLLAATAETVAFSLEELLAVQRRSANRSNGRAPTSLVTIRSSLGRRRGDILSDLPDGNPEGMLLNLSGVRHICVDHKSANPFGLDRQKTAPGIGAALMNRKINYPLPRPTWVCPHCGLVHQAADIVRIDDTQLRCKQCGQAFTPPSAEAKSRSIRFGDSPDLASGRFANGHY